MDLSEVTTVETVGLYLKEARDGGTSDAAMNDVATLLASNRELSEAVRIATEPIVDPDADLQNDLADYPPFTATPIAAPVASTSTGGNADEPPVDPPLGDGGVPAVDDPPPDPTITTEGPIQYKPEWLSTYGANRTLPEAIEEMHNGHVAKDDFIGKQRESIEMQDREIAKLKAKLAARVPKASPVAPPVTDPPSAPSEAGNPLVEPTAPAPLADADRFDEVKSAEYDMAVQAYIKDYGEYNVKRGRQEAREELLPDIEAIRGVVTKVDKAYTTTEQREQERKATADWQKQIDGMNSVVQGNPDVFEGVTASISDIQARYNGFLRDLGVTHGITGSIFNIIDGKETGSIRNDFLQIAGKYFSGDATTKALADGAGIIAPSNSEIGALNRISELRQMSDARGNLPLAETLAIAKGTNNPLFKVVAAPAPAGDGGAPPVAPAHGANPPMSPEARNALARQRIQDQRGNFAPEIAGGERGPGTSGDANNTMKYMKIINTPTSTWTSDDIAVVQQVSDMRPEVGIYEAFEGIIRPPTRA